MKKTVSIKGKVIFKDKTVVSGASIKIWETDKKTSDDLIVNTKTNLKGEFSGSGKWKDNAFDIATFRYELKYKGKTKTGKGILNKAFFNKLQTGWDSPVKTKQKQEKNYVTISGKVIFKDKSAVTGARIKIWEVDNRSSDDLIVNVVTNSRGEFSGKGLWKDEKFDIAKYRYELSYKGKKKSQKGILDKAFFNKLQTGWQSPAQEYAKEQKKYVTISGTVIFKDKSTVAGAKIKIWEVDNRSSDDLIVNVVTNSRGRFSGKGLWKDEKFDIAKYRYELSYKGKKKSQKGILDKAFFNKLQTGWLSPAQEKKQKDKMNITLTGKVIYNDKTPVKGIRIKIWETDNFHKNNPDDLIVNDITDANGNYSGTGPGKDIGGIQTFRYRIEFPNSSKVIESKSKELLKKTLKIIKIGSKDMIWKNWILDFDTKIQEDWFSKPKNELQLTTFIKKAVQNNKKIKVVGSGHSHSPVAKPFDNEALINTHDLTGFKNRYRWLKSDVQNRIKTGNFIGEEKKLKVKSYERFLAGTTVRDVYRKLTEKKLGLINMGPFDGQTISGVINTNTHGTGLQLPGFADMVKSVEMLVIIPTSNTTNKVEMWVIEPSNGISDPIKFKQLAKNRHLVQNDDVFNSIVCGYGLFGIIYSYTLAVRNLYWLNENHEATNWKQLKNDFADLKTKGTTSKLANNEQVKIYINTAQCVNRNGINDKTLVRIDTWQEQFKNKKEQFIPQPDDYGKGIHKIWPPMRKRTANYAFQKIAESHFKIKGNAGNGKASPIMLVGFRSFFKTDKATKFIYNYDKTVYYRAIRRGRDNNILFDKAKNKTALGKIDNTSIKNSSVPQDFATSLEICVPIERTIETIESLMNFIPTLHVNLFIPTGVRFTDKSGHFLAPAYNQKSAFIELGGFLPSKDLLDSIAGGKKMTKTEEALRDKQWKNYLKIYSEAFEKIINHLNKRIPNIRFHKGKFNTYNVNTLKKHYPNSFHKWLPIYHLFSSSELLDCPNSVDKWKITQTRPKIAKQILGSRLEDLKTT